jgi:hypothetical protein
LQARYYTAWDEHSTWGRSRDNVNDVTDPSTSRSAGITRMRSAGSSRLHMRKPLRNWRWRQTFCFVIDAKAALRRGWRHAPPVRLMLKSSYRRPRSITPSA